jgi:hypothetical protein
VRRACSKLTRSDCASILIERDNSATTDTTWTDASVIMEGNALSFFLIKTIGSHVSFKFVLSPSSEEGKEGEEGSVSDLPTALEEKECLPATALISVPASDPEWACNPIL